MCTSARARAADHSDVPIRVTWQISTVVPATATVKASGTTTETVFAGSSASTRSQPVVDPNPTLRVSPVELLTLLDSQASGTGSAIYLAMEPASKGDDVQTPGVYLIDLLPDVAAPKADEPETTFIGGQ